MLVHKASDEGTLVAEKIAGQKPSIDYNLIPGVVYTWPEVASVGQTEEQLKEDKIEYKTGKFPVRALKRSRASGDIDEFVKILADKETDEILGEHIVGACAADLIVELVVVMEYRVSAEDIAMISHAHSNLFGRNPRSSNGRDRSSTNSVLKKIIYTLVANLYFS